MPDLKKPDPKHRERVLDALEELLFDDAAGVDVDGDDAALQTSAEDVRALLRRSLKQAEQEQLRAARKRYEARRAHAESGIASRIPASPAERKTLLLRVLRQNPQLTYANRDFSDETDSDIESALRQLELLGLLEDGAADK